MGHSRRQPEHAFILCRQLHAYPFSEGWRVTAYVNGDIKHLAAHYTNQFALGLTYLVVQAPQHASLRTRVIVLHEMRVNADSPHFSFIETFQEESPFVSEDNWFDDQDSWNLRDLSFH
jgi:hypothetical protein